MKLIYITASFPFGNGESFFIPEINALKKVGLSLVIIPIFPRGKLRENWQLISENETLYHEKLFSLKILYALIRFILINPVSFCKLIIQLKGSSFLKFLKNLAVLPKSIWLKSIIEKEMPLHIHAHWGSTTSTAAMLSTYGTQISWSFTCHRWDIYENNLLEKKSINSNFIRFISEKGRIDAIKFGVLPEKSHVVPMGTLIPINPIFPIWKNNGEKFVIICPANLIPVKGHKYLIEAVNALIKDSYNIELRLAGAGILKKELQQLVADKKLTKYISFLGQLDHAALLEYYATGNAHLIVLPSIDLGNGVHEGVPVSLMEAMSYGVPVLSTETGSINELLPKELGMTVPDKNPDALAEKIKFIYNNPDKYISIAKLCRKIIEDQWDVNLSAIRILALIQKQKTI